MSSVDLDAVALQAMRLQNGYALAVDTRDWTYFRTLFSPDVLATYPNQEYRGMADWLASFVPFHDECTWTVHVMTNHVVGEDADGVWAACYGWVRWTQRAEPGLINESTTLYRDRLDAAGGTWRITRRRLDLLMQQPPGPIPASVGLPHSVQDLRDRS